VSRDPRISGIRALESGTGKSFNFETCEVSKESGPSILEDKWQRSGSYHEFEYREWGGRVLCVTNSRVARSRFNLNCRSRRKESREIWCLATSYIGVLEGEGVAP
jgi:hypothetical protein